MGAILARHRDIQEDSEDSEDSEDYEDYEDSEDIRYKRLLRSVAIIRSRNICCICNIHFKTKSRLDKHMKKYHPKDTYTCDYCNLICETWSKFKKHVYILHKDMEFCTYCYRAYSDISNLVQHWSTHEPLACEICNDTYVSLSDLSKHYAEFHRNVPFQRRVSSFFERGRSTSQEEHD